MQHMQPGKHQTNHWIKTGGCKYEKVIYWQECPVSIHFVRAELIEIMVPLEGNNPYAPIPSASSFGVGFGYLNTFKTGYLEH